MNIYLIRHGKTYGNLFKRYIGTTDEPLCEEGIEELMKLRSQYTFSPDILFVSPMLRCKQTADILFEDNLQIEITDFRECDFGEFENKNYYELSDNEEYQKWIDSQGTLPFPNGESPELFKLRCCKAFTKIVDKLTENQTECAVIVAHGGTIMSIMEQFAIPHKSYYDFQISNGEGYCLNYDSYSYKKIGRA